MQRTGLRPGGTLRDLPAIVLVGEGSEPELLGK